MSKKCQEVAQTSTKIVLLESNFNLKAIMKVAIKIPNPSAK